MLKDHGDKLSDDEKSNIEAALQDAEEAVKAIARMKSKPKLRPLSEASHKLAEKYIPQEQPQQGQQGHKVVLRVVLRAGGGKTGGG